ncbi:MAG: DedA family protein [Hyphomicrobium sp.]
MGVQDFVEMIVAFVRDNKQWAAPMAFLVAFMESFCFLSILWPGTAILVGISALLAAGGVGLDVLWPAIIAAGVGGTVGYALSYWIGRYFKDSLLGMWPFSRHPETLTQGRDFFDKYGAASVFLGHFFGPVRAIIPVVAGMYAMPQIPFQIANIASAFIWAAGVIAPGFFLVTFQAEIFAFMIQHEFLIAGLIFLLALGHAVPMPLLFWPSLFLLLATGLLFLYAGGDAPLLLVAAAGGTFAGDLVAYWIGKSRRADLAEAWPLRYYPDGIEPARRFLHKWGPAGIIVSKVFGVKRAYVPVVAGSEGMSPAQFIPASLVSAVLLACLFLAPRYILAFFGM